MLFSEAAAASALLRARVAAPRLAASERAEGNGVDGLLADVVRLAADFAVAGRLTSGLRVGAAAVARLVGVLVRTVAFRAVVARFGAAVRLATGFLVAGTERRGDVAFLVTGLRAAVARAAATFFGAAVALRGAAARDAGFLAAEALAAGFFAGARTDAVFLATGFLTTGFFAGVVARRPAVLALRVADPRRVVLTAIVWARADFSLSSLKCRNSCGVR